jgi:hypothetical protein
MKQGSACPAQAFTGLVKPFISIVDQQVEFGVPYRFRENGQPVEFVTERSTFRPAVQ